MKKNPLLVILLLQLSPLRRIIQHPQPNVSSSTPKPCNSFSLETAKETDNKTHYVMY
ncbi:hypothetical protein Hanom_Chr02g00150591 [Helianthus anomalus]